MKLALTCLLLTLMVAMESTGQVRKISRIPCFKCRAAAKHPKQKASQYQFVKTADDATPATAKHRRKVS